MGKSSKVSKKSSDKVSKKDKKVKKAAPVATVVVVAKPVKADKASGKKKKDKKSKKAPPPPPPSSSSEEESSEEESEEEVRALAPRVHHGSQAAVFKSPTLALQCTLADVPAPRARNKGASVVGIKQIKANESRGIGVVADSVGLPGE